MTKKQLNALKRRAAKQLLLGFLMFAVATIPVALHWSEDCTGSVFCWMLAGIAIYDSIKQLIRYNK